MHIEIKRYGLEIRGSGSCGFTVLETTFVEEVLGLKEDGDSVLLVRKNAMGLSCINSLETGVDVKGGE